MQGRMHWTQSVLLLLLAGFVVIDALASPLNSYVPFAIGNLDNLINDVLDERGSGACNSTMTVQALDDVRTLDSELKAIQKTVIGGAYDAAATRDVQWALTKYFKTAGHHCWNTEQQKEITRVTEPLVRAAGFKIVNGVLIRVF